MYNIVGNILETKSMIGLAIDNHRITSEIDRGVQLFIERDEDKGRGKSGTGTRIFWVKGGWGPGPGRAYFFGLTSDLENFLDKSFPSNN